MNETLVVAEVLEHVPDVRRDLPDVLLRKRALLQAALCHETNGFPQSSSWELGLHFTETLSQGLPQSRRNVVVRESAILNLPAPWRRKARAVRELLDKAFPVRLESSAPAPPASASFWSENSWEFSFLVRCLVVDKLRDLHRDVAVEAVLIRERALTLVFQTLFDWSMHAKLVKLRRDLRNLFLGGHLHLEKVLRVRVDVEALVVNVDLVRRCRRNP